MNPITSFYGEYRFLSNFWPAEVKYKNEIFKTVEHAYQAAKCQLRAQFLNFLVLQTPGQAKAFGKQVVVRHDWPEVKQEIMEDLVTQKFTNHEDLKQKLLATGNAELIEGNTWRDRYWGMTLENGVWVGHNFLGKILMKVRDQLKEK